MVMILDSNKALLRWISQVAFLVIVGCTRLSHAFLPWYHLGTSFGRVDLVENDVSVGHFTTKKSMRLHPTEHNNNVLDDKRRSLFNNAMSSLAIVVSTPQIGVAAEEFVPTTADETIQVPLQFISSLNAYVVYYSVGGDRFGAILDTGSPFLMIPSYCDETKWGCYKPEKSSPSGLEPTYEQFDNNEGEVEWRTAPFSFVNATGSMIGPSQMIFGVLSESLMDGPGGVFFGLVRDTDKRIRPSFLGQTPVRSFEIDLASTRKMLTLTTTSLINGDYIPLVKDLNRRYGDPTIHYTARANSIRANGTPLGKDGKPIYVIFDTGVTGMVVSQELFDERYAVARAQRERNLWGKVDVSFTTKSGKTVSMEATKPLTTPFGEVPWKGFNAHLVVVGLSFLDGNKMTVDIDKGKLWLEV
mmetsp:Transcript_16724/g.23595  ORF Transcript_16724/g.23595 Transcript_16724/m.23595 type:complete len:414 (+) Transcript_16724:43-1284(+)